MNYYFRADGRDKGAIIYGGGWTQEECDADTAANCGRVKGDLLTCDSEMGRKIEAEGDGVAAEAIAAAALAAEDPELGTWVDTDGTIYDEETGDVVGMAK